MNPNFSNSSGVMSSISNLTSFRIGTACTTGISCSTWADEVSGSGWSDGVSSSLSADSVEAINFLARFPATAFFLDSLNVTAGSDGGGGADDYSVRGGGSEVVPKVEGIGLAITMGGG